MERIRVFIVDLPGTIHGATIYSCADDGMPFFTILLNAQDDNATQIRAYDHEIEHIVREDFCSMVPADHLENIRHVI